MQFRRLTIFSKLLLAIAGTGLFVALVSGLAHYLFTARLIETSIRNQMETALMQAASRFEKSYLVPVGGTLRLLESSPVVDNLLVSTGSELYLSRPPAERMFVSILKANPELYLSIRLLDADGNERLFVSEGKRIRRPAPALEDKGQDGLGEQTAVLYRRLRQVEPGTVLLHGPIEHKPGKLSYLAGITKREPEIGGFGGGIIAQVDLSGYLAYLSASRILGQSTAWLFDKDGRALLRAGAPEISPDPSPYLFGEQPIPSNAFLAAIGVAPSGGLSAGPAQTTSEQRAVRAYLFHVALSVSPKFLTRELRQATWISISVLIVVLCAGSALAFVLARELASPIRSLSRMTAAVSQGDLQAHVPEEPGGELGQLAASFNRMVATLRETTVSKTYLDNIIASMTDMLIIAEDDGVIARTNDCLRASLGYSESELLEMKVQDLVAEDSASRQIAEALRSGATLRALETVFVAKDGGEIPVSLSSAVMYDRDTRVSAYVCVARDVTERKRTEEALAERARRFEALTRTSAKVAASIEETQETLTAIAEETAKLLSIEGAGFRLLDGDRLVAAGRYGLAREVMLKPWFKIGESLSGTVAQQGQTIAVSDLHTDQRFDLEHRRAAIAKGIVSYLGTPLRYRDRLIGVLNVYGKEQRRFSEEDIALLQAFADHAAIVIEKARLYGEAKQHEERFRDVAEAASDWIWEMGPDLRFSYLSDRVEAVTGAPASYFVGKRREEVMGNIADPEVQEHLADLQAHRPFRDFVYQARTPAGRRYFKISGKPLFDDQGVFRGYRGTGTDITATRQAAEALRRYERIVSASADLMAFLDTDYVYRAVNDAYVKAFGKSREEIVGHHMTDLLGQEVFQSRLKPQLDKCLAGSGVNFQHWLELPNWGLCYLDVRFDPMISDGGSVSGVAINVRNITERKRTETELEHLRRRNELILQSAGEGIYGLDLEGRTTFINPAAAKMLGWEPEELIGKLQHNILHHTRPDGTPYPREECPIYAAFKDGTVHHADDEKFWRKDGTSFPVEYVSTPIREQGKVVGAVVTFRDITERRRHEGALRNIAAGISAATGDEFFRSLARYLAKMLEADYVLIGGLSKEDTNKITTIAVCADGEIVDNFEYELAGSPCENVVGQKLCVYTSGVQRQFPDDALLSAMKVEGYIATPLFASTGRALGLIAVMYRRSTPDPKLGESMLQIFAARAAAELERKAGEQALHASEKRYRALYDDNPAMFLTLDSKGTICSVNRFGAKHLGYEVEELLGTSVFPLYAPDQKASAKAYLRTCIAEPDTVHRWEACRIRKDEERMWVRETSRVLEDTDGSSKIFMVCEDITEAHTLSQKLAHQATHDALTGLVNRLEFERRVNRALQTARAEKAEHALCYLDLDQFKVINDTCGHIAGDELLRQVAALLQEQVRKRDTLARLGGDEFGVLLEHCNIEHAQRVATTWRTAIEGFRFAWEDKSFSIGVSIGLVPITELSETMSVLLSTADSACYAAKESGRNRIHVYHEADTEVPKRTGEMQWVARINQAIDEGRFALYFQPIVAVSGKTVLDDHYELLIRMQGDDGRMIAPGAFLGAAERYNLSSKIDRWVVETAFAWLTAQPQHLQQLYLCSLNLSGLSLGDDEFLDFVVRALEKTHMRAEKICFEVTETAAIANLSGATRFMKALQALGCRFALDDFGSGLSSFAYLKTLPVDFLKIDGAFVTDIVEDPVSFAMVKSISDMGHILGKKIIAEFVENDAILKKLKTIGVDYAQGYGVGHPRPVSEMMIPPRRRRSKGG